MSHLNGLALVLAIACAPAFAQSSDAADVLAPSLYASVSFGGSKAAVRNPKLNFRLDYRPDAASFLPNPATPAPVQLQLAGDDSYVAVAGMRVMAFDLRADATADNPQPDHIGRVAKAVTLTAVSVYATEVVAGAVMVYLVKDAFTVSGDSSGSGSGSGSGNTTSSGSPPPADSCSGINVNNQCIGGP